MKRRLDYLICALLCTVLLGGCMSLGAKCTMVVSNSGDKTVSDVIVELSRDARYSSPAIMPHSEADSRPLRDRLPAISKVSWKNSDGVVVSKEVRIEKPLPEGFRGRILFQIDGASEVKIFVMPDTEEGSQLIPWGHSPDFDGTVLIPGMNQQ
jgi:hypothetical protein